MITWSDNENDTLDFLIQPQEGFTAKLPGKTGLDRVVIDGPYGKNLKLETYETVILVAKGIGIAGILGYAKYLIDRRFDSNQAYRRGLKTRKIDLLWILDDNCQEEWVSDYMKLLQDKDSKRVCLFILWRTSLILLTSYYFSPASIIRAQTTRPSRRSL
jgi:hypothetical protein